MRATLVFDLPNDEAEHYMAVNGRLAFFTLLDVDNYLRSLLKYGLIEPHCSPEDVVEQVRDKLHRLMDEYELNIYR